MMYCLCIYSKIPHLKQFLYFRENLKQNLAVSCNTSEKKYTFEKKTKPKNHYENLKAAEVQENREAKAEAILGEVEENNFNTEQSEKIDPEKKYREIYDKYLKKFENTVGFFELDNGRIEFVDRTKRLWNRSDLINEAIDIPVSEFADISQEKFVYFVNKRIRLQYPGILSVDDNNEYWDVAEKYFHDPVMISATHQAKKYPASFLRNHKDIAQEIGKDRFMELLTCFEPARNLAEHFPDDFMRFYQVIVDIMGKEKCDNLARSFGVVESLAKDSQHLFLFYADEVVAIVGEEEYKRLIRDFSIDSTFAEKFPEEYLYYSGEEFKGGFCVLEHNNILARKAKKNIDISHYAEIIALPLEIAEIAINISNEVAHGLKVHENFSANENRRYIARYLYYRRLPINGKNIDRAIVEIDEKHESLKDVSLFENRNVTFLSHNELTSETRDPYRFGKIDSREKIKTQTSPDKFKFIRAENGNEQDLAARKKDFKDRVIHSGAPCTFVLDGHGEPSNFFLTDGETQNDKITVDELVDWIVERHQENNENNLALQDRPIFMFMACWQANLIQSIFTRLQSKGIIPPIMMSIAEYNRVGFSDFNSKYGSSYFEKVFDLPNSSPDNPTTFENIYNNQHLGDSNMMIWVPDEKGLPVQIADNNPNNIKYRGRLS